LSKALYRWLWLMISPLIWCFQDMRMRISIDCLCKWCFAISEFNQTISVRVRWTRFMVRKISESMLPITHTVCWWFITNWFS
jgi:hypothetical protein